jgi:NADH:ubiquinone oxidoreductase subunit F (NADH-binding)
VTVAPAQVALLQGPVRVERNRVAGMRYSLADELAPTGGCPPDDLPAAVIAHQLRGCGGGNLPVAVKWRSYLNAGGHGVLVANGAESEPPSAKDIALMMLRPHLVLDGIACVARVLAADPVLWLHSGAARRSIDAALRERRDAGLADPPLHIVSGPDRYLGGESSAIVSALSGRPALPAFHIVPAAHTGVHGRPTVVHNVETLARIALLARGAQGHGRLLTVAAGRVRTVVSAAGTLAEILANTGFARVPRAVLLGGYAGTWLPWDRAAGLDVLAPDVPLGAGVVLPLPPDACGLDVTARLAAYLAAGSARQCGPCLFGLRDVSAAIDAIARRRARPRQLNTLRRHLDEIVGRGACGHPEGAVQLVRSALDVFADELVQHVYHRRCTSPGTSNFYLDAVA